MLGWDEQVAVAQGQNETQNASQATERAEVGFQECRAGFSKTATPNPPRDERKTERSGLPESGRVGYRK